MPSGKSFRVAPGHINVYYNLANLVKMDPARMQEAFRLYQRAIAMKPDFVEAHMNKGDLLLHLNRTEEAREAFETALKHNPHYTDAHYNLGSAMLQLGRRGEAEKSYRDALRLDSNHVHALLGLASLLQDKQQDKEAFQL
jgi:tetratricopeptide (TPR) repeat protein